MENRNTLKDVLRHLICARANIQMPTQQTADTRDGTFNSRRHHTTGAKILKITNKVEKRVTLKKENEIIQNAYKYLQTASMKIFL
jgi:hypothetical protein